MFNFIRILFKGIFLFMIIAIIYGIYYGITTFILPLGILGYIILGLAFIILIFPLFVIFKFLFGMVMS